MCYMNDYNARVKRRTPLESIFILTLALISISISTLYFIKPNLEINQNMRPDTVATFKGILSVDVQQYSVLILPTLAIFASIYLIYISFSDVRYEPAKDLNHTLGLIISSVIILVDWIYNACRVYLTMAIPMLTSDMLLSLIMAFAAASIILISTMRFYAILIKEQPNVKNKFYAKREKR